MYKVYTTEREIKQTVHCEDCDWKANENHVGRDAQQAIAALNTHIKSTGHTVTRKYTSKTVYHGQQLTADDMPPEARKKEAPKRTVWCKTCKKQIAEKATGIVIFWAAKSHQEASGHEIEIVEADGSRRPL